MSAANLALIDTSVYIDNLRSGRFKDELLALPYVIRCSAVVITRNGADFKTIREFMNFKLICW